MKITFASLQRFFKSWGLYPSKEPTDDYNEEVIRRGINGTCYKKMRLEVERNYGIEVARFCSKQIEATDDSYYLRFETWDQLKAAWLKAA